MTARSEWLRIEIRHLGALTAVARESSFSGAADSLGYVQSAVSQQVVFLERVVGHRLVERAGRPRSATLTDAGATLVEHAEDILGRLRAAKEEIDGLAHAEAPAFGIAAGLGGRAARRLLGAAAAHGWTRAERAPASELLVDVERGELDGAFVELPLAGGPFFAMELLREPYVLAVPGRCGGADAAEALREWPLVAVDGCPAPPAAGPSPFHAGSAAAALAFVRAGVAVAAVPEGDAAPGGDVRLLPLPGVPARVVGLVWRRDRDGCAVVHALRAAAVSALGTR